MGISKIRRIIIKMISSNIYPIILTILVALYARHKLFPFFCALLIRFIDDMTLDREVFWPYHLCMSCYFLFLCFFFIILFLAETQSFQAELLHLRCFNNGFNCKRNHN
eukprot:15039_1